MEREPFSPPPSDDIPFSPEPTSFESTTFEPAPFSPPSPEPTPSLELETPASSKNGSGNPRILLTGLALILVGTLLGVIAANFLPPIGLPGQTTPTPTVEITPTAPLTQSVTSLEYSFSVEMPVSWIQSGNTAEFPYLFQYQATDNSTFEILVRDLPKGTSITQYLAQQDKVSATAFEGKPSKKVISTQEIVVNGVTGVEREEEFLAAGLIGRVIYLPGKTKVYSLSFIPGTDTAPIMTSQIYQDRQTIIDSFRITGSESSAAYTCPPGEWVDCMPGPGGAPRPECETIYLDWAKANCPGFKGAAL